MRSAPRFAAEPDANDNGSAVSGINAIAEHLSGTTEGHSALDDRHLEACDGRSRKKPAADRRHCECGEARLALLWDSGLRQGSSADRNLRVRRCHQAYQVPLTPVDCPARADPKFRWGRGEDHPPRLPLHDERRWLPWPSRAASPRGASVGGNPLARLPFTRAHFSHSNLFILRIFLALGSFHPAGKSSGRTPIRGSSDQTLGRSRDRVDFLDRCCRGATAEALLQRAAGQPEGHQRLEQPADADSVDDAFQAEW